jgi:hypothetical protein
MWPQIRVTNHAVQRFRERFKDFPDKKIRRLVRRALQESVTATHYLTDKMTRLRIRPKQTYWYHHYSDLLFVVADRDGKVATVITVI